MSPTSYQTAPPRIAMVAHGVWQVKLRAGFLRGAARNARRDSAEAPLALMEFGNRIGQIAGPKLRPHPGREDHLGISGFPQKKITEALFAAGADQQVDLWPKMFGPFLQRGFG